MFQAVGAVCGMTATQLSHLGYIARSFSMDDISCLNLDDNVVAVLGYIHGWTQEQVRALYLYIPLSVEFFLHCLYKHEKNHCSNKKNWVWTEAFLNISQNKWCFKQVYTRIVKKFQCQYKLFS